MSDRLYRTPEWQKLRRQALERAGGKCEACGEALGASPGPTPQGDHRGRHHPRPGRRRDALRALQHGEARPDVEALSGASRVPRARGPHDGREARRRLTAQGNPVRRAHFRP